MDFSKLTQLSQSITEALHAQGISQALQFRDENGMPIMILNGMFSLSQIIGMLVIVIGIIAVLSLVKGALKTGLTIFLVICGLLYFNIATPAQIVSTTNTVIEQSQEAVEKVKENADDVQNTVDQTKNMLNKMQKSTGN